MKYVRMAIEKESPEEHGYSRIQFNLSESSIADQTLSDLGCTIPDLKLLYSEHRGATGLRELIAQQGEGLSSNDVLITAGAAGALFIIATTILSPPDHLIVVRPNYATNIETPKVIGCEITYIDLNFDDAYELDVAAVRAAVRPNTRLISVTTPHNPTGVSLSLAQLRELIALTEASNCRLLVDETYADMTFGERLPIAASLSKAAISVSSMSKSYGIPGIRVGWLITRDSDLYEKFLAAKEQIGICGSVLDEWVAQSVLSRRQAFLDKLMPQIEERLQRVADWVADEPLMSWIRPTGGVVCFPRLNVRDSFDLTAFYQRLLSKHGTYVGPGHWFDMPKRQFRIGYAWPTEDELAGGLKAISTALRD